MSSNNRFSYPCWDTELGSGQLCTGPSQHEHTQSCPPYRCRTDTPCSLTRASSSRLLSQRLQARTVVTPPLEDGTLSQEDDIVLSTSSLDKDEYSQVGTAEFASVLHDHPIMQLILQRAARGSRPGARRDGAKLGLVVEGGGMRGIVSG